MKKRVIVTRDQEKAAPLIKELREYGVDAMAVPVTHVRIYDDLYLPENLDDYDMIAITSASALNAFKRILDAGNKVLPGKIKFAAVGEATAGGVKETFGKVDIIPDEQNALSLAKTIIERSDDPGSLRIFWPCANNALPELEIELNKAGTTVTPWVCYETVAMESRQIGSRLQSLAPWDLVFFAAPSAVEAFSAAWKDKTGFIAIAIGPTTEQALRKKGYSNIAVSGGTSTLQCAGAIVDALGLKVWS